MEDECRMSTRACKVAPKMAAALASADNRTQVTLAWLEALENDNAGIETVEINEDDHDEGYMRKRHSKGTIRKTRQAKTLEDARKAPRSFLELLHEANPFLIKLRWLRSLSELNYLHSSHKSGIYAKW